MTRVVKELKMPEAKEHILAQTGEQEQLNTRKLEPMWMAVGHFPGQWPCSELWECWQLIATAIPIVMQPNRSFCAGCYWGSPNPEGQNWALKAESRPFPYPDSLDQKVNSWRDLRCYPAVPPDHGWDPKVYGTWLCPGRVAESMAPKSFGIEHLFGKKSHVVQ